MTDAHKLNAENMLRALPEVFRSDSKILALATTIAAQLDSRIDEIDRIRIYPQIENLPEDLLDILAYDFKIDWWDYNYSLEQKRQTLKDSFSVHKHLGTKYAVETAISAIYPNTKVLEWFEYGGDPYTFMLVIDATNATINSEQHQRVLNLVDYYKNLRSHLKRIKYTITPAAAKVSCTAGFCGAYMRMGVNVQVNGEVDRPHSRYNARTGARTAGTYMKLTMEVAVNGVG